MSGSPMVPVPTTCTMFFLAVISPSNPAADCSSTIARPMATKPDAGEKVIATNRKAFHDYFVLQKVEAGLALTGTEVKSLRDGQVNLKDSYVSFDHNEAFLVGAHISPYSHGNLQNH